MGKQEYLERLKEQYNNELKMVAYFVDMADKHQAKADKLEKEIERYEDNNEPV